MLVQPQFWNNTTDPATDKVFGFDIDVLAGAAGDPAASVLDLNGYRGAIVTVGHSPRSGGAAAQSQFRLKHGDAADSDTHEFIDADVGGWGFFRLSTAGTGFPRPLTFLVDAKNTKRYLSASHEANGNQYYAATAIPVGPLYAKDDLDDTRDLFITGSGELSFPDLS